jgi:pilus assembly protein Flp/PilA
MPIFARLQSVQHRHRVIRENAMNAIRKFLKQEDGVTALEYGLLAAVIAGIIIFFARDGLTAIFTTVLARLEDVVAGT